ncbi:MAG: TolB-like translocation protein [Candidatus Saccharimonadales bacterium]
MEDKSGQPEKHPKGRSIPVNIRSDSDPNKKTLADYVPPSLDDPQIDKVIDDIIMSEGNEVLAAEDTMRVTDKVKQKKSKNKLIKILKNKWLYIGLGVVIVALFCVPYSRYLILGTFIKNDYTITVIDSVTNSPVSDTSIKVGSQSYLTNASGQAVLKLNLGKHQINLDKQYYAKYSGSIFVGLSKNEHSTIKFIATGRQVLLTVLNKISGTPLSGVKISVLNTSATTNSEGQAQIVLPTKQSSYEASITANSFNSLTTPIQVTTNKTINVIRLIPSGNIYYLSNSTGTINVIKANLDGSNPTIELAGTGKETNSTILMPSPDWKYLVLEANRSGSQELYMINTSDGSVDEFDSAADNFTLIGWSGDSFIYDEIAPSLATSNVGREQIRSFTATNNQLNIIDENQVVGSGSSYGYQSFANFQLLPNLLLYTTSWNSVNSYDISSQNDTVRSVEPNGLNKKDYMTFGAANTGTMSIVRFQPQALYVSVLNSSNNQTSYYTFSNGALNGASLNQSTFSQAYPTFYLSPSGTESLWDAGSDIYIGNQTGQNQKRLIVPNGFSVYGWYDNIYVLLQKSNQLYIVPSSGSNNPILIGSYFSPS